MRGFVCRSENFASIVLVSYGSWLLLAQARQQQLETFIVVKKDDFVRSLKLSLLHSTFEHVRIYAQELHIALYKQVHNLKKKHFVKL